MRLRNLYYSKCRVTHDLSLSRLRSRGWKEEAGGWSHWCGRWIEPSTCGRASNSFKNHSNGKDSHAAMAWGVSRLFISSDICLSDILCHDQLSTRKIVIHHDNSYLLFSNILYFPGRCVWTVCLNPLLGWPMYVVLTYPPFFFLNLFSWKVHTIHLDLKRNRGTFRWDSSRRARCCEDCWWLYFRSDGFSVLVVACLLTEKWYFSLSPPWVLTIHLLTFRSYDGGGPSVYWHGGNPSLRGSRKVVDQTLSGM